MYIDIWCTVYWYAVHYIVLYTIQYNGIAVPVQYRTTCALCVLYIWCVHTTHVMYLYTYTPEVDS